MDGAPASGDYPLDRLFEELNFRNSLASEGNELRALTLGALAQSASVLERVASDHLSMAGLDPTPQAEQDRLRSLAARAGTGAARARELYAEVEAIPIEKRRPSVS